MARALLADRGVIEIAGTDATPFLQNIVTNSISDLEIGEAAFAALLAPQGKIFADGILIRTESGFLFECAKALIGDLIKKLTLYRLRAKVTITDRSVDLRVIAIWNEEITKPDIMIASYRDPRLAELGWRQIVHESELANISNLNDADTYHAHRIALGVPEGGKDFTYGDIFPHEADMDQLNGIDFKKGCYVGQEVVSRMQHRGLARTRAVPVIFHDGFSPESGTPAEAQGKQIGVIGSSAKGGTAIAVLRLDRVEEALAAGAILTAGGLAFSLETRPWIGFSVPRSQ